MTPSRIETATSDVESVDRKTATWLGQEQKGGEGRSVEQARDIEYLLTLKWDRVWRMSSVTF
jgi:hypothetical protein